jgi:hypothetical protein
MHGWNNSLITINDSILYGNDANSIGDQIATATLYSYYDSSENILRIDHSNIQDGEEGIHIFSNSPELPITTVDYLEGNLNLDPLFVENGSWFDPNDNGSFADADFEIGDYHLKSAAGRWKKSFFTDLDPDRDNFVNMSDFASFASFWGKQGKSIPADLDNDGRIDQSDLKLFMNNYLMSYRPYQLIEDDVTSPCVDAGDPLSEWKEELWPHGEKTNMGAYGNTNESSLSPSAAGNKYNLDGGAAGLVNNVDFAILSANWLCDVQPVKGDFNFDGTIDIIDLTEFANNWLNNQ